MIFKLIFEYLHKSKKNLLIITCSAITLYFVISWVGIPDCDALLNTESVWLLISLFAVALSTLMITLRWQIFLGFWGLFPSRLKIFSFLSWLSFAALLLPKELVEFFGRTWWLKKRYSFDYFSCASSILTDRFMDVIVLGMMFFPAICFMVFDFSLLAALLCLGVCVIVGGVILLFSGPKTLTLLYICLHWLSLRLIRLRNKQVPDQEQAAVTFVSRTKLLSAYLITVVKFLLIDVCYWSFSQSLDLKINFWVFFLIVPVIQLFFLFSFTAGGAGFIEAGWYVVLTSLNISETDIATYLVAQRIFFTILLGIIACFVSALSLILGIIIANRSTE